MTPATGTALLLIGVFVLPGFITLLLRERSFTVKGEDSAFERLLNALFYSALIYSCVLTAGAVLGLDKADLVAFYRGEKTLWEDLGAGVVIALVLPMVITELGLLWQSSEDVRPSILKRLGIDPGHQVLSGWNQMFGRRGTAFLRVTLKDDRVLGGYYGDGSLAGYSEHTQDLFIVERWELDDDGWFTQKAPGTLGIWIPHDNIASVEVYEAPPELGAADGEK